MLKKIRSLVLNYSFIEIYDNVLSSEDCDRLITEFESSRQTPGKTAAGYNPERKKSKELVLPRMSDSSVRSSIIFTALDHCINKYKKTYPSLNHLNKFMFEDVYTFKKFETPEDGFKVWHTEHGPSYHHMVSDRILVWMFYLNDAKSGTEFMHYPTMSAKKGRCIIWPASFTHVHRSAPNKGVKYIISGWISYAPEHK